MNARAEPRHRVLLTARAVLPSGGVIDCIVRDRSAHGARLKVQSVIGIPDHFELAIESSGEKLRAEVSWRKLNEIGVRIAEA